MAGSKTVAAWVAARHAMGDPASGAGQGPGDDPWQLLAECQRGQAQSARRLVDMLAPLAFRAAYRVMGNRQDAEDVVQEAFLSLWRAPPVGGRGAQLSSWFVGVTLNACRSRLRQRRLLEIWAAEDVVQASDASVSGHAGPPPVFESAATTPQAACARLDAAMRWLTPRQRLAIAMWAYTDATAADIAKALGIEPNAAHQLLFKAKQSLRRQLAPGSS